MLWRLEVKCTVNTAKELEEYLQPFAGTGSTMSTTEHAQNAAGVDSPTAARAYKHNQKVSKMPENKKPSIRIAASSDLDYINWPTESVLDMKHDAGNLRSVTVRKVKCTHCKGSGAIELFTSGMSCDKCLGQGSYYEGATDG